MVSSAQSLGGRARAKRLTRDERRRIAKNAARARWANFGPREVLENREVIEGFCRRYGLRALYAFGSILTPGFGRASDVDLLYVVGSKPFGYSDYCDAMEELQTLLGREVDFINRGIIEQSSNRVRRRAILDTAKLIYEAR